LFELVQLPLLAVDQVADPVPLVTMLATSRYSAVVLPCSDRLYVCRPRLAWCC